MGRMEARDLERMVDMDQVPDEIHVRGYERDPDQVYSLGDATDDEIDAALDWLQSSELLGHLDIMRVNGRWHVMTHARTPQERVNWLLSIKEWVA